MGSERMIAEARGGRRSAKMASVVMEHGMRGMLQWRWKMACEACCRSCRKKAKVGLCSAFARLKRPYLDHELVETS
eukprot:8863186-Heterocapsa_arctica.AAC.1